MPIWLAYLVVFAEGFVIWLLIFSRSRMLNLSACMLLFSVFTIVSFFNGLAGKGDCGCFGSFLSVPPFVMAIIDGTIASLAFSLILFPERGAIQIRDERVGHENSVDEKSLFLQFRSSGWLIGSFGGMLVFATFSHSEFMGLSRNAKVAEATPVAFGAVAQSEGEVTAMAMIKNISERPFRLIGGGRSCRCVSADFEMKEVMPGEFLQIPVKIDLQKVRVGQTRQRLIYYLGSPFQRSVTVEIEGEML